MNIYTISYYILIKYIKFYLIKKNYNKKRDTFKF